MGGIILDHRIDHTSAGGQPHRFDAASIPDQAVDDTGTGTRWLSALSTRNDRTHDINQECNRIGLMRHQFLIRRLMIPVQGRAGSLRFQPAMTEPMISTRSATASV